MFVVPTDISLFRFLKDSDGNKLPLSCCSFSSAIADSIANSFLDNLKKSHPFDPGMVSILVADKFDACIMDMRTLENHETDQNDERSVSPSSFEANQGKRC